MKSLSDLIQHIYKAEKPIISVIVGKCVGTILKIFVIQLEDYDDFIY